MRRITHIVVHASATPEGREVSAKEIDRWHRARGFRKIGYHYVIHLDGSVSEGRREVEAGAHVAGHNSNSIGICYIGGVERDDVKKPKDTRTDAQKVTMERLIRELLVRYPGAEVLGHRDFPGVAKACPCFDTRSWWTEVNERTLSPYKNIFGTEPPHHCDAEYTVVAGDTLWGISQQLKVNLPDLLAANGMSMDYVIQPGEKLRIPG